MGHWEGDLIVGRGRDGFILTLVERTLYTVKLNTKRAEEVARAVIDALLDCPLSWVEEHHL